MKIIKLTKGKFTTVSDEDYEMLSQYKWQVAEPRKGFFYAQRRVKNCKPTVIFMHRIILNAKKGEDVDHINHDTLNNQRNNIRIATRQQNQANQVKTKIKTASIFKGVTFENGKWRARIRNNGKKEHLGSFSTEIEAALSYNKRAVELNGNFACLNVIPKDIS